VWLPFFISKLSDEPCARHALHALAAVCASDCALSIEAIGQLPLQICDALHVPSQLQPARHHALSIFKRILSAPHVVPRPASRVVECLVTSVDAERDPRNLLLVFDLVQIAASTPNFHPLPSSLVEELFNATFCYFPIRFKRAASDIGSVSPEVLSMKLRDALFSSTAFAPFLYMGLSQRIAADEDDDVIAALQCLNLSFKAFPASTLAESCDSLWGTLSHAAVDAASDRVAQACRDCITCLVAAAAATPVAQALRVHAVSFVSSAIRRPDEDDSRRTFRVFMCVVAAAESSDASADDAAAAAAVVNGVCSSLSDAFLSCGPRPRAQLEVINMALELALGLWCVCA